MAAPEKDPPEKEKEEKDAGNKSQWTPGVVRGFFGSILEFLVLLFFICIIIFLVISMSRNLSSPPKRRSRTGRRRNSSTERKKRKPVSPSESDPVPIPVRRSGASFEGGATDSTAQRLPETTSIPPFEEPPRKPVWFNEADHVPPTDPRLQDMIMLPPLEESAFYRRIAGYVGRSVLTTRSETSSESCTTGLTAEKRAVPSPAQGDFTGQTSDQSETTGTRTENESKDVIEGSTGLTAETQAVPSPPQEDFAGQTSDQSETTGTLTEKESKDVLEESQVKHSDST